MEDKPFKSELEDKHPATCKFLREEVYPDYHSPLFYIVTRGRNKELAIRFLNNTTIETHFTPINEVEGWILPCGGMFELNSSEYVLRNYYGITQ